MKRIHNRTVDPETLEQYRPLVDEFVSLMNADFHYAEHIAKTAIRIKGKRAARGTMPGKPKTGRNPQRQFTWEQAQEIRRLYAIPGTTFKMLARQFGCGTTTISGIIQGKTYLHP